MGYLNFFIFLLSIPALFYSGGLLVRSLTVLGRYMQLSEYIVSFVLVAFATSLPEFFVGINSAIRGAPLLSLGNLIGANFLNISFVLGLAVIFARGLDVSRSVEKEDTALVLGIMAAPIVMAADGIIGRIDGIILLSAFAGYVYYLLRTEHKRTVFNKIGPADLIRLRPVKQFLIFLFGTGLLLASSSFIVSYSVNLARVLSLPLFVVGILISVGTTLPEAVFSIKSVVLKHGSMSLGNVFGSIIVNISLILGAVAVISPVVIEKMPGFILGSSSAIVLVGVVQAVSAIKGRLEYRLGVLLMFAALLFVLVGAMISGKTY